MNCNREVKWLGDTRCNLCGAECGTYLGDVRLPRVGAWAVLCESCMLEHGVAFGVGMGQLYKRIENAYVKVYG